MTDRRSFYRKVAYLCVIVALILAISWLSPPATEGTASARGSSGGKLAQMRAELGLSQANLGQLDPTSEALKLSTLGMRGVAADILWAKATEYQKTRNWTGLSATLEQIIKLQPNFISVWRYQSWNLAYNISADWDDYRDRYAWVKKGIYFLEDGKRYNAKEAILHWDSGWFIGHKIGRADERREYRQLFREDEEFHGDRPVAQRDNWLVAKEKFRDAERLVDATGRPARGVSPLLFYSDAPKSQINYAVALEEDGQFGEVAKVAWNRAQEEWQDYARRDIPHYDGSRYRLDDFEAQAAKSQELTAKLHALEPELAETMKAEKKTGFSPEVLKVLDKPYDLRTEQEKMLASTIAERLEVPPQEFIDRASEAVRAEAQAIAGELQRAKDVQGTIENSRNILGFNYWRMRCALERTDDAIAAREHIYKARQLQRTGALVEPRDEYLAGFKRWRAVLDQFPAIMTDGQTGEEMLDEVIAYEKILKQLEEPKPDDFPLQNLIDANRHYYDLPH